MPTIRSAGELADTAEPAWPTIQDFIRQATGPVAVLPIEPAAGEAALYRLQVTARSALGALALNAGGLLVDSGWIKVLGGGADGLPDLATASGLGEPGSGSEPPGSLTVAYDSLGGVFAVNGGALPAPLGKVCYFAPDTLDWVSLDVGHGKFVEWVLTGDLGRFYGELRWEGWQAEISALAPGEGLSLYPPPWTREGEDLEVVSRKPVPIAQLVAFHQDAARQLTGR